MKLNLEPTVKIYTAATPLGDAQPKRFSFSKQLLVNEVIPITGDPSVISSAISSGDKLHLNRLLFPYGVFGTQFKIGTGAAPQSVAQVTGRPPEAKAPVVASGSGNHPQVATMAPTLDGKQAVAAPTSIEEILKRAVAVPGGYGIAKEGFHVLKLTQTTTHGELVSNLTILHVGNADGAANSILDFVHTQGCASVLFGVTVGGAAAALVGVFLPGTGIGTRAKIGATTALIAGLLFYFLLPALNPFVGEWQMNAADSRYVLGSVPRAAKTVVSENGNALTISENVVDSDGKSQQLSYVVYPDGKDHPAEGIPGVDTTLTTLAKKHLTTLFTLNGRPIRTAERVISSDQKKMTETVTFPEPDGKGLKNVIVYETK
jgi:hypothetical protein